MPGTHTACLCYWVSWQCLEPIQSVFAIGFSFPLFQKLIQRVFAIRFFVTWMSQIALAWLGKTAFFCGDDFLDSQGGCDALACCACRSGMAEHLYKAVRTMLLTFAAKTDTACLCYSVLCALDVRDRSCVARKESVFLW